jgi:hypothetical protein
MISEVRHMLNNHVEVYDRRGFRQVVLEGKFEDVIDRIMAHVSPITKFYVQGLVFPVSRELFASKGYYNFLKRGVPCKKSTHSSPQR